MTPERTGLPTPLEVVASPRARPYWDALRERRRIEILRCQACGRWVHYPRARCPACWSDQLELEPVSGRGAVVGWTVTRRPTAPQLRGMLPITAALVELDEQAGLRLLVWYIPPTSGPAVGQLVELVVVDGDGQPLPVAVSSDR